MKQFAKDDVVVIEGIGSRVQGNQKPDSLFGVVTDVFASGWYVRVSKKQEADYPRFMWVSKQGDLRGAYLTYIGKLN